MGAVAVFGAVLGAAGFGAVLGVAAAGAAAAASATAAAGAGVIEDVAIGAIAAFSAGASTTGVGSAASAAGASATGVGAAAACGGGDEVCGQAGLSTAVPAWAAGWG